MDLALNNLQWFNTKPNQEFFFSFRHHKIRYSTIFETKETDTNQDSLMIW